MKKIKVLLIALILILGGTFFSSTYATDTTRSLGAQLTRPYNELNPKPQYRYTVGDNLRYTVAKIYDAADKAGEELAFTKALYCLRGGKGFGADVSQEGTSISATPISYTELGEMHTGAQSVIDKYNELYGVNLDRNVVLKDSNNEDKTVNLYNAILWVLDESYLPTDNGTYHESDYKEELLNKAGIDESTLTSEEDKITKDDIEVIQQLATWYFANYDEQPSSSSVSQETMYPVVLLSINDYAQSFTTPRAENLNKLYQYLIYGAIENASSYEIDTTTQARTKTREENKFDKSAPVIKSKIKGNTPNKYYEIGPVKFQAGNEKVSTSDIILYDAEGNVIPKYYIIPEEDQLTGEIIRQSKQVVYMFVDSNNNEVTELEKGVNYRIIFYSIFTKGSTIQNMLNLTLPKFDISKMTIQVAASYTLSTATFLYANENPGDNQAVVDLNKTKISDPDEVTTVDFDLSLRKYITSIKRNGNEQMTEEQKENRKPKLDLSKLDEEIDDNLITTATYEHVKNALAVETNDTVIYTIRIYNEGETDGKALKVTDYLPEGLALKEGSTINSENGWENPSGDGKTIETEKLNNVDIKAYNPEKTSKEQGENWQQDELSENNTGLYYADLQIECVVTAEFGESDKSLRNIAEISGENMDDRDSTPENVDRNNYNPPEDNSSYQEDDDDYEDLVLKAKTFDLALRKFISKVEREENGQTTIINPEREPKIYITDLKNGDSETARYVHPKEKLSLKRGDIIYYTIRIYNEGDLTGKATQVKDYVPEGLEPVTGQNDSWNVDGNVLTTKPEVLQEELPGYDRTKTTESEGWQKAEDDQTGLFYKDLTVVCRIKDNVEDGATLVNIAEIYADLSIPTDIDDRDSQPANFPDNKKNNEYNGNGQDNGYFPGQQDDDDFEPITVEAREVFDLSLRKYITKVNGVEVTETRNPDIDKNQLNNGSTTAEYKHRKDPVEVQTGSIVTYKITIYNEGEQAGRATKIVDQLPAGLRFKRVVSGNYVLDNYDETENKVALIEKENENEDLPAYDKLTQELESTTIEIECEVTEQVGKTDKVLTNIAWISEEYNAVTNTTIIDQVGEDRDSEPANHPNKTSSELKTEGSIGYTGKTDYTEEQLRNNNHFEGQQDDDDFEKVVLRGKEFDLALRKYITSIKRNGQDIPVDDRTPKIDLTTLDNGTFDRRGTSEYTATYEHSKEPLVVKKGDIVTYTIRVYNEGQRDGYASEITDYLPKGLAFINNYGPNEDWSIEKSDTTKISPVDGETAGILKENANLGDVELVTGEVILSTTKLNKKDDESTLIKAYDPSKITREGDEEWQQDELSDSNSGLYYREVQLTCLVVAENTCRDVLTNIAEISEYKDEYGNILPNAGDDRDSVANNVEVNPYTPTWQEDDDDFDPVVLTYFDLALRKFITGVETNGTVTEIDSRIPQVSLNTTGEGNLFIYTHPKGEQPVEVANNDIVIYTIRVYNEGTLKGYAQEVSDDIPEGLEYLPKHSINTDYGWVMLDKDGNITDKLEEAVSISTDYLSEEKGQAKQGESQTNPNELKGYYDDRDISSEEPLNPDYLDVKVAFRVTEPNTSDRIIINSAQIAKDKGGVDIDSVPGVWNEGEDDQDREFIYVKYFDLSLLKWVTETVVTVDGKTTTTETGFKPNTGHTETTGIRSNSESEPVAKVEIDKKKIDKTTVKFKYKITVTNEGEIAGYATEVTDFIPVGLEFKEEDNKKYGWTKSGDDKVVTRALETKLLNPGEVAELEIVFTWKNDKNNLGVKTNIAEITEDYNIYGSKDIDSTPNNKKNPYDKEQEDDDDYALVVLSLKTGKAASYVGLVAVVVTILTGGIYLIKKYVLMV